MTRNRMMYALALLLLVSACKKNDTTTPPNVPPSTPGSSKKGADFSTTMQYGTWNADVVNLKAFWYYTWGTLQPSPSPQNCDFVSMFWGAANVTDENISAIQAAKAQGKVKYVLGFNEPNRTDQSNMTVSQALALWPKLESIGLPLGSPAADWPTRQWIYDFLDSCIAEKKRVDFICVHMYQDTNDVNFVNTLQDLYNKYHLPIWITEFAVADWNATTIAGNAYSVDQVQGFMQRLLPKLESLSYVQRYSWFSGDPKQPPLWSSALIDVNGNLTTLGSWYANYQPNKAITK